MSTAIDLVGEPTSGTNVFVRDPANQNHLPVSPSPDAGPFSGGELGALGQQTISISRDGSRVAFTSDSNLDPDTIDDNPELAMSTSILCRRSSDATVF
ncbi:MAG: hypothetical protein R3C56_30195 [Pirellulaceae bacterium]